MSGVFRRRGRAVDQTRLSQEAETHHLPRRRLHAVPCRDVVAEAACWVDRNKHDLDIIDRCFGLRSSDSVV